MGDEGLSGLNEQQRSAVTIDAGAPVLVLAGAGCGKTTVLTRRVEFLCRTGIVSQRLLALTFTRKAAVEMSARISARMGADTAPLVTTFHGFAYRFVRESVGSVANYRRLGYDAPPRVLDEPERLAAIARRSTPAEREALGVDVLRLDALLDALAVNPALIASMGDPAASLLRAIDMRLREQRVCDNTWLFSDIIESTFRLLDSSTRIAELTRARFRAVLVDEFQDTNPLQIELLRRLTGAHTHVYAVGDDDQAIYGFRGADSRPITEFRSSHPGARLLKLEINYRSSPVILSLANRIFRNKPVAYRKVLRCPEQNCRQRHPRVVRRMFVTQQESYAWAASHASELSRRSGVPTGDMAALFRLNDSRQCAEDWFATCDWGTGRPIQCLTIHGSKGLEFPVVFLCDLEEGVLPHYRIRKGRRPWWQTAIQPWYQHTPSECDIAEETRLFYVGVTRARDRLCLLSVASRRFGAITRKVAPSRFLRFR